MQVEIIKSQRNNLDKIDNNKENREVLRNIFRIQNFMIRFENSIQKLFTKFLLSVDLNSVTLIISSMSHCYY